MKLENQRILLVEDCPDQQRLFLQFLLSEGAEVDLECDGYAAVRTAAKAQREGRPFVGAIMDLFLTQSDGIEATRAIVAAHPHIAIVAVTANGCDEVACEWYRAGCMKYLEKPVAKKVLVENLIQAIEARQSLQTPVSQFPSSAPPLSTNTPTPNPASPE